MTYYKLLKTLRQLSLKHYLLNEFGDGDVYEYMNSGNHKYPCLFITLSNISTDTESTQYKFTLFYIDRLTDDLSNKINVQSTGVEVIKHVLSKLVSEIGTFDVTSTDFTMFTEKFADMCGGVFCNVVMDDYTENLENEVNNDDDCAEKDFNVTEIRLTENGIYDIAGYDKAVVSVPSVTTLELTEDEYDNLSSYDDYIIYLITE